MVLFVFAILLTHKPGDKAEPLTSQKKALGLTAESLGGRDDNDPLIELTKTVRDAAEKGGTITRRSK